MNRAIITFNFYNHAPRSKVITHIVRAIINPLRLLYVGKRIKNKSRSYYSMFLNVLENTTRHSVFSK